MTFGKITHPFYVGLSILLTLFLFACGEDQAITRQHLEDTRPSWVPSDSVLLYGVDGSTWADCKWKGDLYHCKYFSLHGNASVEQSYKLCSMSQSKILIDRPADNGIAEYKSSGFSFIPVTPPIYYQGNELDSEKNELAKEEYRSLDIASCSQQFSTLN